jgi:hypothetical protein
MVGAAMVSSKVEGSKVRIFATRKGAQDGARAIGWPVGCVTRVHTRFQLCWALGTGVQLDPNTGLPYVSREWFGELWHARNDPLGTPEPNY